MEYAKDLVWPLWELGDEIHRARMDLQRKGHGGT